MDYTGKITNRTIDIDDLQETETSITINSNYITISYKDENNNLMQLKKVITDPRHIEVGDLITTSDVQKNAIGGFGVKSLSKTLKTNHVCKTLTSICDWNNLSDFDTQTFFDQNNIQRTAVKIPVMLM